MLPMVPMRLKDPMLLTDPMLPTDLMLPTDPMLPKDLMLQKDPMLPTDPTVPTDPTFQKDLMNLMVQMDRLVLRCLLLVQRLPCHPLVLKDQKDPTFPKGLIHY
jgi:hypothetical protein